MAATTAFQQGPSAFLSRFSTSIRTGSVKPANVFFSGGSSFPKLINLKQNPRRSVIRKSDTAAASYAAALADVANENGTLDATVTDLEQIEKLFSDEEVMDFFANPIVSEEEKRELIDKLTADGNVQEHIANFLNVLLDNNRLNIIKEIVKEFEQIYNTITDTEVAVVTSVVKLEPQHMAQIAKQVQQLTGAKNVRIKTVIDESLVAGFTILYGGSQFIDMSVKTQLEEIAANLEAEEGAVPVEVGSSSEDAPVPA